jgi:hypothetical protein
MSSKKEVEIKKFSSFDEQAKSDDDYYESLTPKERLEILFSLIGHKENKDGTVERCVRIYPLAQRK